MDIEKRMELITREPTEEVVTNNDLRELLETKKNPRAYDGFEPSGILHLGAGLMRSIKLQDMIDAKCKFTLYVADWFAFLNNKMNGDINLIRKNGKYFIEGWKACGVDTDKIDIVWCSDLIKDPEYWELFMKIGKKSTLKRTTRCMTIMGRQESELAEVSQLFYPIMQCTDIFKLGADITQLGMDQRKVNILAREIAPKLGLQKPVVVSHHLLMGLQGMDSTGSSRMNTFDENEKLNTEISVKMSKSIPSSSVFIHDSEEEIKNKIKHAFCPVKQVEGNPIMEICKYIIFRKQDCFDIHRPEKFGGDLRYEDYNKLENDYKNGNIHPLDLKNGVSESLNELLSPVRKHFEKNKKAKELYEEIKNAKKTR